jgi:hypothetical protein
MSFGGGNLQHFGINSNTSANGFLKCTYKKKVSQQDPLLLSTFFDLCLCRKYKIVVHHPNLRNHHPRRKLNQQLKMKMHLRPQRKRRQAMTKKKVASQKRTSLLKTQREKRQTNKKTITIQKIK